MKKKMLCLAMAVTMGLSMTTTAFAKVGSGKTDTAKPELSATDAAMIAQYVYDATYNNPVFDVKEANYDGDVKTSLDENGRLVDNITTKDAAKVLRQVYETNDGSQVMITVTVGMEKPVTASERINPNFTHTKVLDFMDKIIVSKDYDKVIEESAGRFNSYANNLTFKGKTGANVSIRDEAGWKVFADAVAPVVKDQAALDALKIGKKKFEVADDLRSLYSNAKAAFKINGATAEECKQVAANVIDVTGKDFVKVIPYGYTEDGVKIEGKAMNLQEVADLFVEAGLNVKGEELTIDNLVEVFGPNFVITGKNPTSGVEHRAEIMTARK